MKDADQADALADKAATAAEDADAHSTACIAAFDWYSETASIEDAADSTNWEAFP